MTATANTQSRTAGDPPPPSAQRLTRRQQQALAHLPSGHELIAVWGCTPIVRRPDGQLARMRSSGRLVTTGSIRAVQSYLLVNG